MTGMTRVFTYTDSNIPVRYQALMKKIEEMGARKVGRFVVHCRMLSRRVLVDGYANQRMYLLRMSQNDDLIYAVLGNERTDASLGIKLEKGLPSSENGLDGPLDECCLLECGLEGSNILQQVEIYLPKSDGKFEGMQFLFGDFLVSICTFVCRANTPTGLTVEVQYKPCSVVGDANQDKLLDEFMSILADSTPADAASPVKKPIANILGLFHKLKLGDEYSHKHTAIQYVAAFNLLRK
ncbi:hypothetical protein, variant [Aphanomyces invadans]|nr:hypothetical protein, variant [Aphanomyces invadans]ETW09907.1 hypothetical protein, variant [Aphanomyces invadans]|eukprot:XP_008861318.1 hypothetical protein, variant [Aphanomyces invadans]